MIKNVVEMFEFVRYRPQENVKRCLSPQHTALRNAESFKNKFKYMTNYPKNTTEGKLRYFWVDYRISNNPSNEGNILRRVCTPYQD